MCKCTPMIKTPFCGEGDCQWPEQQPAAEKWSAWPYDGEGPKFNIGEGQLPAAESATIKENLKVQLSGNSGELESVKPCPQCGSPVKRQRDKTGFECTACEMDLYEDYSEWWCYRRIAEQDAKIADISAECDTKSDRILTLERRNAELESANVSRWEFVQKEKADLERQLKEAKELSELRFRDLCTYQKKAYVLEQQLKEAKVKEIKQTSEIEASNILIGCLEQQVRELREKNEDLADEMRVRDEKAFL